MTKDRLAEARGTLGIQRKRRKVVRDVIRAVDEDVRSALMHAEEVILRLPGRWNDPLVPDECSEAFRAAYASLAALTSKEQA